MGLLKILLYLLLLLFPLGVVIRVGILGSAYFYLIDIILILIFLNYVFLFFEKKELPKNLPVKSFLIFFAFAFLTLLLNFRNLLPEYFLVSFLYLLRVVLYSSLIFVFIYLDKKFTKRYILLLAFSGFVTVLFGFIQYFYYPNLRNLYYLGWDEHLYRMFSTFLDPNFAGVIFVLELILLLRFFQLKKGIGRIEQIIFGILAVITTIGIFLTYSRSTFIMLIASVGTYLFTINKKRFLFLFFLVMVIGMILLPKNLRSEGVVLLRTASISGRESTYMNALTIFKDSPIVGVGFNSYRYAQERYGFLDNKNWQETHSGAGVSNSYLFILVTTGVIGFVLFLNFWIRIFKKLGVNRHSEFMRPVLLSSLVGVFTHAFFENTLFYPFIMIWIFILLGVYFQEKI